MRCPALTCQTTLLRRIDIVELAIPVGNRAVRYSYTEVVLQCPLCGYIYNTGKNDHKVQQIKALDIFWREALSGLATDEEINKMLDLSRIAVGLFGADDKDVINQYMVWLFKGDRNGKDSTTTEEGTGRSERAPEEGSDSLGPPIDNPDI